MSNKYTEGKPCHVRSRCQEHGPDHDRWGALSPQQQDNPIQKWAKDLNRNVFQEDTHMANGHLKRGWTSLVIRELQSKPQCDITARSLEWLSLKTNRKEQRKEKCW